MNTITFLSHKYNRQYLGDISVTKVKRQRKNYYYYQVGNKQSSPLFELNNLNKKLKKHNIKVINTRGM